MLVIEDGTAGSQPEPNAVYNGDKQVLLLRSGGSTHPKIISFRTNRRSYLSKPTYSKRSYFNPKIISFKTNFFKEKLIISKDHIF